MTATRTGGLWLGIGTVLLAAGAWVVVAWLLWDTSIPSGLRIPDRDARDYFTQAELDAADRYELFHRVNWLLSTVVLFVVLGLYAVRGARFMRESAAGRIGTGMLLAMLGFGLVWLVQVPFAVAGNWWDRRHDVSEIGYVELLFGGWLALGAQFLFLSLAVLIVMGLAGLLGDRWWIPGSLCFVALATLFVFVSPYLSTQAHSIEDDALAADVRRLARLQGVEDVEVLVEDVDRYTSAANAYTTGIGPSRRVFLWNTLLDGRFEGREVRAIVAHEFGHQSQDHLWEAIAWYALFAIPGAWAIARITRRRGGMRQPEAVPLALLALAGLTLAAQPLQNVISRHMEAEADWEALETTRDPEAMTSLFQRFSRTSLGDPTPPGWAYVMFDTHPPLLDRIEMAQAWKARNPGATPLFDE
ncbi:MAG TPA: M48 family metalloprotease [Gaiellaceae bacterium]|nr:M48 family metalloprotease [Gaiellaceae bacterium]